MAATAAAQYAGQSLHRNPTGAGAGAGAGGGGAGAGAGAEARDDWQRAEEGRTNMARTASSVVALSSAAEPEAICGNSYGVECNV